MNFKEVLKEKNKQIIETRAIIETNKILVRDCSAALAGLKGAIREANRKGDGKTVSSLSRQQNLRRHFVRNVTEIQKDNRQILRETYMLRSAIIAEWVKEEEEKQEA